MNKKDIQASMRGFKSFKKIILELLYPSVCVLCGEVSNQEVCDNCKRDYSVVMEARCMCCGKAIERVESELCEDCNKNKKSFYQGRSLWLHRGKVKDSIYLFKYKNRRVYGETYARLLVKEYRGLIEAWNPECIVPVPSHRSRKRKRGYNQAEVLGGYISKELDYKISLNMNMIYRKNETIFQKTLDNRQRRKNIRGAFQVYEMCEIPETVLVIDDIYTTGATMQGVAKKLKSAGVRKVVFLTISVGQGY